MLRRRSERVTLVPKPLPAPASAVVDLMVAAANEDPRAIADALFAIGTPSKRIDRQQFEAEVGEAKAADPDAVVVIGFEESARIIEGLNSQGIGPRR